MNLFEENLFHNPKDISQVEQLLVDKSLEISEEDAKSIKIANFYGQVARLSERNMRIGNELIALKDHHNAFVAFVHEGLMKIEAKQNQNENNNSNN